MKKLLSLLFLIILIGTFSNVAKADTAFFDRFTGSVLASIGKAPVTAATTGNITLSGNQIIDSIAVSDHIGTTQAPDRVLVKNQTDQTQNGIYTVSSTGAWARAKDFSGTSGIVKGQLIYVVNGATNFGFWTLTTNDPITVGQSGGIGATPSNITFTATLLPVLNSTFGPGALKLSGATSGFTIVNAANIASGTMTMPAGTDQLVGQNTTDILTNKTFDSANNTFKLNGVQITSLNGSTANLATVSGVLTSGHCVSIDSNHNIIDAGGACTTGGGGGTVSAATAGQLAYYASSSTIVSGNANVTIGTAALTLGQSGSVAGTLKLASSGAAGVTILAQNSGTSSFTVTLPAATDTLVGRATTDTITNKSIAGSEINSGTVGATFGGTGQNSSAATGIAQLASGVWSFTTALINGTTATTQSPGDSSNRIATDAFVTNNSGVTWNAITGAIPTAITGTSTTGAVSISAGQAADSTNVTYIISAGYSWTVANGNAINGYQGGTTLPINTTIHFFLCKGISGVASFAHSSLTPTCPSGYNVSYRRVFSLVTDGAGALIQGNAIEADGGSMIFYLVTPIQDVGTTISTSRLLLSVTTPMGLKSEILYRASADNNGGIILTSGDESDLAPNVGSGYNGGFVGAPGYDVSSNSGFSGGISFSVRSDSALITNTSAQFGARGDSTSGLRFVTRGWKDFRRT